LCKVLQSICTLDDWGVTGLPKKYIHQYTIYFYATLSAVLLSSQLLVTS
jgi:hypothetical protein